MSDPIDNLTAPRRLDVSHLATTAWDSHAPPWWGNFLLGCIETTTVVLMIVTYFYLRRARETINDPDGSRYDLEKIEGNVSLLESRHQERLNMLNSTGPWNVPGYMKRMYEEFPSMNAEDQVRLRKSGWPARAQNSCT